MLSHPTWVRGLKHLYSLRGSERCRVAPYVGAWIETSRLKAEMYLPEVAPYVGAWIETLIALRLSIDNESHPTWVRGLKLGVKQIRFRSILSHPTWVRGLKLENDPRLKNHIVAPYVGAWIETELMRFEFSVPVSHPTWVRGLKQTTKSLNYSIPGRTLCGCVD